MFMNDRELIWEKYQTILNEAIPLAIAKKAFTRKEYPINYTPEMNKIFDNKDRIILPFNSSEKLFIQSDTEKEIEEELRKSGWWVYHDDYVAGYIKKDNQKYRLGKVLQQLGRMDLLDKFKKDTSRQLKNKDLVIVISRHPYDIAGASTDRNWKSCISRYYTPIVYKGKKEYDGHGRPYKRGEEGDSTQYHTNVDPKYHKCDENEAIIAYLVNKDELINGGEKVQLRKPLSRILIYREDDGTFSTSTFDYDETVYGVQSKDFVDQVENWMLSNFKYTPIPKEDETEDEDF